MTMTEPSCQSADCNVGNESSKDGQINKPETCELSGQEVENANCAGGGTEELINGDLSDYNNFSASKALSKEETRGVYFYDRLVTGYLDPPDPWKHVVGWNSEQIAYQYKRSCDKHGTKPLPKVLPQIQIMVDNGKRHECLNLKGEKLDHKHCECVEEILKFVQFESIDLEGSHLDDECAVALFDMIEYYDSACQLNISFNKNIGVRGWQACSRLIRKTPHLTYLDMRNCDLNERSVPIVGRALKLGSTLTVLHMENIYLSGRSLMIMVAALKMNEILEELFLADNKLMPSDGIQLGTLLKFNHHLQLLDVRNNHLQDVGTSHLCDGLYEQNLVIGLKTLVLWNNGVTYQCMAALGRALSSTENLVTLNLGHNNITNEGIHRIKEGLLKSKSLLRFGLQGVKVTCEGAVALAEFVADSPRLLRLDLRENEIKTAGLMALSLAMRVNETVTRIDLDKDTKKESGMKDYAVQQRRLHHEIITYMDRNQKQALQQEEEQSLATQNQVDDVPMPEISVEHSELASESVSDEPSTDTDSYIPSAEKIHRKQLLFSHDTTPQQTLESPHDFHQLAHEHIPTSSNNNLTLHLGPPSVSKPFITTPPTELLLSPQYAPQLTAKKIFSVSKVSESSSSKISSSGRDNVTSAVTLCQNLATETVNEYIEQIVSDNVVHTTDDVVLTGDNVVLTSDNVVHTSDNVVLTSDNVVHTSDNVVHTSDNVVHTSDNVVHTSDNVVHTSDNVVHTSDNVVHTSDNVVHKVGDVPTISDHDDPPQEELSFQYDTNCDTFRLLTDPVVESSVSSGSNDDDDKAQLTEDNLDVDSDSVNQSCEEISEIPDNTLHSDAVQFDEGVDTTGHSDNEVVETTLKECDIKQSNSDLPAVSDLSSTHATLDHDANSQSVIASHCDRDRSVRNSEETVLSEKTNYLSVSEIKPVDNIAVGDVEDIAVADAGVVVGDADRDVDAVSQSNTDTKTKDVVTGAMFLANNSTQNTDCLKNKADSGIGSYENDQWLKVESSELGQQSCDRQTETQPTEKPNFHTSLSVNGLARELASVLDSLDEQVETSYTGDVPKESSEKKPDASEDKS